ncbi:MAG: hypothetical protein AAGA87_13065 [Pseudomonadota bacterium]
MRQRPRIAQRDPAVLFVDDNILRNRQIVSKLEINGHKRPAGKGEPSQSYTSRPKRQHCQRRGRTHQGKRHAKHRQAVANTMDSTQIPESNGKKRASQDYRQPDSGEIPHP